MGLFDGLGFNPSSYGGQGGGLLDLLRTSLMQQQQYQPSSGFGEMALPANAQPTQGAGAPVSLQPPAPVQTAPAQQPQGFLDRINAGLQSIGNGGSVIGALTGNYTDNANRYGNVTQQAMIARGFDPELAKVVSSDPSLLRAVLPSLMGGGQTDDIKEYQFAKREDPSLTFDKFMARKRSVTGEHGLNIVYGTNDRGETVALQPSKSGGLVQAQLPSGVKLSSGVDKIDLGTEWGIIDKRTGQMVGRQAKDLAGKEAQEEVGKARGQAQVNLPNVLANAEQTLRVIQDIKSDPYRERGTGFSSVLNNIPATGGFDFAQKVEQLKGKAFLEAFQSLKGGGAITEIEGKKAENAIARLNTAQSEGAFLQSLNELEEVVTAGIARAQQRAGQGVPAAPASAPKTGFVDYRTYFGNK